MRILRIYYQLLYLCICKYISILKQVYVCKYTLWIYIDIYSCIYDNGAETKQIKHKDNKY
jgi:hypothetical protein